MLSCIGWTYTQNDPWSLVPVECHITHRCYKIVRITVYLDKPNFAHAIHATGELVLLRLLHTRINSLWPSDAIWQYGPGSALAQVITCCLTASSHYLLIYHKWALDNNSPLMAISQKMHVPQPSITTFSLKITYLKFHSKFQWALIPSLPDAVSFTAHVISSHTL